MIVVCFLLFFHTLFSCSVPSRVRVEEGLFEGLLLLIPCKVVSEKSHFETFIHFLLKKLSRTKNDQNRQDSVTLFSILLLVRLGRRGSLRIVGVWPCCSSLWPCSSSLWAARVHGKASVHAAPTWLCEWPASTEFPWAKWLTLVLTMDN